MAVLQILGQLEDLQLTQMQCLSLILPLLLTLSKSTITLVQIPQDVVCMSTQVLAMDLMLQ